MGSEPSKQARRSRRQQRRFRRKRRVAVPNLRKAMFVLPNLFTISSVFCGFYAIVLAAGEPTPKQLYQAALAVFFGAFFDGADGRVARLTRTQSDFGVQLDSLADAITFGVAPGLIAVEWGLGQLGLAGVVVGFVYVACGVIRLARFNVLASNSGGGSMKFFIGLPIPLSASVVVSLVMFHQHMFAKPPTHGLSVAGLLLVLSYLMVSNVRYWTFKHVRPNRASLAVVVALAVVFVGIAIRIHPTFALLLFFAGYVVLGLLGEILFFGRRRRSAGLSPAERNDAGQHANAPVEKEEQT